jgi:hypothetical protein
MLGRGNRSALRNPAPVPPCPSHTRHEPDLSSECGRHGGKPVTNSLSYAVAWITLRSKPMSSEAP